MATAAIKHAPAPTGAGVTPSMATAPVLPVSKANPVNKVHVYEGIWLRAGNV